MLRKMLKVTTVALFTSLFSSLAAMGDSQILNLSNGWNLKGSLLDNVQVTETFNKPEVISVWKWVDGKWAVWSPQQNLMNLIEQYVNEGKILPLSSFNSGEGFWINTSAPVSITMVGNKPSTTTISIKNGWTLLSLKSSAPIPVETFNKPEVISVWKWVDGKWAVWSPQQNLMNLIEQYVNEGKILPLNTIYPGEGFWVNAGGDTDVLETPPAVGFAYVLQDKLNAIPLSNADVYINGKYVGKTDEKGQFSITDAPDGSEVVIKKKGVTTAYGVVKNGIVVVMAQQDYSEKVPFSSTEGATKPISKGITSKDGTVSVIVDSMALSKDITVSVVPFMSTSAAPPLNSITVDGQEVTPDQMALIGGAFINVEDSNGNLLSADELANDTVNFKVTQTSFLGDLDKILNGDVDVPSTAFQSFSESAYQQLSQLISSGQADILVLQFINGKWQYKGKAQLVSYTKVKKLPDGTEEQYTKYKLQTASDLDKLAPIAFVLKMNYLTGQATVCTSEGGYKMFDGSIVTAPDSNSPNFDWIGDPIPEVTVIGDDGVVGGAGVTDASGCTVITYKVPFLKPTFSLAFKKDGYYDSQITCEVTTEGAVCDKAVMYRVPDTASIEGYVRDKISNEGIDNALVTLVNPEVLSADKVKTGIDEETGYAYVEVGYMPNVTYTWEAVKYDDEGNKVVSKIIKEGKGDPTYSKLTEKEIFDALVAPFDNGTNDFPAEYLTGKWELHVKAVHSFTNTNATLTEEAIGSFDIDLLMTKLAEIMTGQLSEKKEEVVVDENGNQVTLDNAIGTAGIYGGLSLGFLYEYGAQNDKFSWKTQILAAGDPDTTGCIDDPIANALDLCYIDVANDTLIYNKALYPVAFNVKFLAEHFTDLLKPDPTCEGDSECNGMPFLKTGFTIRTLYQGEIDVPVTDPNTYDVTYDKYEQLLASYVDVPYDLNRKVEDMLDIPEINLVGPSVTAYMRQVITGDNGYYRINMIPPELSGNLEIFAKAEGYKFDANTDIKLVNDLEAGKVSEYDLYLEPIETPPSPSPVGWDGWTYENYCSVNNVKWQIVSNPINIKVSNEDWANTVWNDTLVTLLPDVDNSTEGYLWFGDNATGLFSDTGSNYSSSAVCGKAISPVFDLSNYAFPVLTFKSWFEVESVDVAKDEFDQMKVGFIIPSADNGNVTGVTVYTSDGNAITLQTDTYYPITVLNPDFKPDIQDPVVPFSTQGVNALPVWKDFKIPVDSLAGLKVRFVFDFNSVDSLYNGFRGWGIDSVKVEDNMEDALAYPLEIPNIQENTTNEKAVR